MVNPKIGQFLVSKRVFTKYFNKITKLDLLSYVKILLPYVFYPIEVFMNGFKGVCNS